MLRRRVLTALPIALLPLVLLAGCGSDQPTSSSSGDRATTTTSPPASTAPDGDRLPSGEPVISGTITSVTAAVAAATNCMPPLDPAPDSPVSSDGGSPCSEPDPNVLGTVVVEEVPGEQEGAKISFTVTRSTVLVGDGVTGFEDLARGQEVDGWADGPMAESYPAQAEASALRVTG